jgi:hypothetical protein
LETACFLRLPIRRSIADSSMPSFCLPPITILRRPPAQHRCHAPPAASLPPCSVFFYPQPYPDPPTCHGTSSCSAALLWFWIRSLRRCATHARQLFGLAANPPRQLGPPSSSRRGAKKKGLLPTAPNGSLHPGRCLSICRVPGCVRVCCCQSVSPHTWPPCLRHNGNPHHTHTQQRPFDHACLPTR